MATMATMATPAATRFDSETITLAHRKDTSTLCDPLSLRHDDTRPPSSSIRHRTFARLCLPIPRSRELLPFQWPTNPSSSVSASNGRKKSQRVPAAGDAPNQLQAPPSTSGRHPAAFSEPVCPRSLRRESRGRTTTTTIPRMSSQRDSPLHRRPRRRGDHLFLESPRAPWSTTRRQLRRKGKGTWEIV